MTPQEVKDLIADLLPDNTNMEISESDLRSVCNALADLSGAGEYDSLSVEWSISTTYSINDIVTFQERIWKSKIDSNLGNSPPTDPNDTSNAYWEEQSKATTTPISEWSAGVYGSGIIVVLYNNDLYKLENSNRPFLSENFDVELFKGDWVPAHNSPIKKKQLQLSQSQIQNLNTTPVQLIAAPGPGKVLQVVSVVAHYLHNGTDYAAATTLRVWFESGTGLSTEMGFISSSSFINASEEAWEMLINGANGRKVYTDEAVEVSANADATGAGGTIDIEIEYIVKDTKLMYQSNWETLEDDWTTNGLLGGGGQNSISDGSISKDGCMGGVVTTGSTFADVGIHSFTNSLRDWIKGKLVRIVGWALVKDNGGGCTGFIIQDASLGYPDEVLLDHSSDEGVWTFFDTGPITWSQGNFLAIRICDENRKPTDSWFELDDSYNGDELYVHDLRIYIV